jgi:hypothetical protein
VAALPASAGATSPYTARFAATSNTNPATNQYGTVSANADGMVVADFNGDGLDEAAIAKTGTNSIVRIDFGSSPPFTEHATPMSCAPGALAVRDVDLDGDPDIVAICPGTNQIDVLTWNGSGFTAGVPFATIAGASEVTIADVDGEGSPDAIVASPTGNQIGTQIQIGFTSAAPVTSSVTHPVDLAPIDIDRNGTKDLAVVTGSDNHLRVMTNGGGAFAVSASLTITDPEALGIIDANDDGDPDILVGTGGGTVLRVLGQGSGGFTAATQVAAGFTSITDADVGDLDRDHLKDVAFSYGSGAAALLTKGNGFFNITTSQFVPSLGASSRVGIGDANGDEANDLVTFATSGSPNFMYALSRPVVLQPNAVDFGSQTVGQRSANQQVAYTNYGAAPLFMAANPFPLTGDAGDFGVAGPGNNCGFVPPGATCSRPIFFQPTTTGTRSTSVDFPSNSSTQVSNTAANVQGTGVAANSGPQGPQGPRGPRGAPGPRGAQGPRGRPGRDARVTCKVRKAKKHRTKVKCTVKLVAAKGKAVARLSRKGRTFARGRARVARGRIDVTMRSHEALPRGRYLLTVRIAGRTIVRRRVHVA